VASDMKHIYFAIPILIAMVVVMFAAEPLKRETNVLMNVCARWLFEGEIVVHKTPKGGNDWDEEEVLSLQRRVRKEYPDSVPVVLRRSGPKEKENWFSFDRKESRLVSVATGTNTMYVHALEIIIGRTNGSTQEMILRYSMSYIFLKVISGKGKDSKVTLAGYEIMD